MTEGKRTPEHDDPPTLTGEAVLIRALLPEDGSETYAGWMNDPGIVEFTESRFDTHTPDDLKRYIEGVRNDPLSHIWAICDLFSGDHLGNIKLGPIDTHHLFGDIGLIIGERSAWGRGVGTESILLVCGFAFKQLLLHKVTAGMYEENIGSKRAFEKAGFTIEGIRTSQYLHNDHYTGAVMMGRTAGESH